MARSADRYKRRVWDDPDTVHRFALHRIRETQARARLSRSCRRHRRARIIGIDEHELAAL